MAAPKDIFPEDFKYLVWTTTPWTIPANLAIAVGDDLEYSFVKVNDEVVYLVATALIDELTKAFEWVSVVNLKEVKGRVTTFNKIPLQKVSIVSKNLSLEILTDEIPTLGVSSIIVDYNSPNVLYVGKADALCKRGKFDCGRLF